MYSLQDLKMQRCFAAISPKAKRILEIGCGDGTYIRAVKNRYEAAETFGCDINIDGIREALLKGDGTKYLTCDAVSLPYKDETFDMIIIIDVLEHILDIKSALKEIYRVLKKGGELYCNIPCEGQPFTLHWFFWKLKLPGYKLKEEICGHVQRFTFDTVIHLIRLSNFEINSIEFMYHPIGQISDMFTHILKGIEIKILSWIPLNIKQKIISIYKQYKTNEKDTQDFLILVPLIFEEIRNDYRRSPLLILFVTILILLRISYRVISMPLNFLGYYESKMFHKTKIAMSIDIVCKKY